MFSMFVIVAKVANLLLPFATWMIFFLCYFHIILALDQVTVEEVISFDVCRNFLFIFLFLVNILIKNIFLSRYFCAVCSCYT